MSSCELEIVLEKADKTFRLRENVRGVVGVTVDKTCRCRALEVVVEWYTHGSGNTTHQGNTTLLFAGEWTAGEKHLFPFEIPVGDGPLPYHGHHLNVDWRVVAKADIPWGFDPRAEVELIVLDDPAVERPFAGPFAKRGPIAEHTRLLGGLIGLFLIASSVGSFGIAGLVALAGLLDESAGVGLLAGALSAIPSLIFAALGLGLASAGFGPWLAARRLGQPRLTVHPEAPRPGEDLSIRVTVAPRGTVPVTAIYAIVSCTEQCVSGSGTKARRHTHEVWSERVSLGEPRALPGGLESAFEARVQLPSDAPPSFGAIDNALDWMVEVHVELPRMFDWSAKHAVVVSR